MGQLSAKSLLFFDHRLGIPILAPNFPGWACDLCDYFAYDPIAISQLQAMLWIGRGSSQPVETRATSLESDLQLPGKDQRRHP